MDERLIKFLAFEINTARLADVSNKLYNVRENCKRIVSILDEYYAGRENQVSADNLISDIEWEKFVAEHSD